MNRTDGNVSSVPQAALHAQATWGSVGRGIGLTLGAIILISALYFALPAISEQGLTSSDATHVHTHQHGDTVHTHPHSAGEPHGFHDHQ